MRPSRRLRSAGADPGTAGGVADGGPQCGLPLAEVQDPGLKPESPCHILCESSECLSAFDFLHLVVETTGRADQAAQ